MTDAQIKIMCRLSGGQTKAKKKRANELNVVSCYAIREGCLF